MALFLSPPKSMGLKAILTVTMNFETPIYKEYLRLPGDFSHGKMRQIIKV